MIAKKLLVRFEMVARMTNGQHQELSHAAPADPMDLLRDWFTSASETDADATTATLATVNELGHPSTRSIAVLEVTQTGLVMFSNMHSRKGRYLARNSAAALTHYWSTAFRQINVSGQLRRTTDTESDRLWQSRGLAGQAASLVSTQGEPLTGSSLRMQAQQLVESGGPLLRPSHHVGIELVPETVEFWEGRADRIHLRRHYEQEDGLWRSWLLQP